MHFSNQQIDEFWQNYQRFLKVPLVTEAPNPKTTNLSRLCQTDLSAAFALYQQVEIEAVIKLEGYSGAIKEFAQDVKQVLTAGDKIFLVGCGASGRLAMLLTRLWDYYYPNCSRQIICVSGGGDISLIKAVEQFEDSAEFGVMQLLAQGFTANDMVIGISASGESNFIAATLNYASRHSIYQAYMVCNNLPEVLLARNQNHPLARANVKTVALDIGPMALSGSTRLQATTVMQIALGYAFYHHESDFDVFLAQLITDYNCLDLSKMATITLDEANILTKKEYLLYLSNDSLLGLSLLADLTERSPTFNLPAFENQDYLAKPYSPFYLSLINCQNNLSSWDFLLRQKPFCLNWQQFATTSEEFFYGFDLSYNSKRAKGEYLAQIQHQESWLLCDNNLDITLGKNQLLLPLPQDPLQRTLFYKLYLNSHSTLTLGRMGYFQGNLMLYLKPANFKLVDRAIRYAMFILQNKYSLNPSYHDLAHLVFKLSTQLTPNDSIVNIVVNGYINSINS